MTARAYWLLALAGIVAAGILSRAIHSGSILFDKYLGDALYAAMVYTILRLLRPRKPVLVPAIIVMLAIELFQLTMIPARLYASGHPALRIAAHVLGTTFSVLDLLAYAVGIAALYVCDRFGIQRRSF
jgi:hypothetical protein